MKTLFAKYMKERGDHDTLENNQYFCVYRVEELGVYIADLFVDEKYRNKGLASKIIGKVEKIAKKNKKPIIAARLDKRANNFEKIKVFSEKVGYKLLRESETAYYVVKEL